MSEFKGTGKGKSWQVCDFSYVNKHGVRCIDIDCKDESVIGLATTYEGLDGVEEGQYNAQLISCAPEMLDMLQNIVDTFENGDTPHVYQIQELITKATTI